MFFTSSGLYVVSTASGILFHDMVHPNGKPTAADFDGDGKADFALITGDGNPQHTAFWAYDPSSTGTFESQSFGKNSDLFPSMPFIP
jgi:hypothetical protein